MSSNGDATLQQALTLFLTGIDEELATLEQHKISYKKLREVTAQLLETLSQYDE